MRRHGGNIENLSTEIHVHKTRPGIILVQFTLRKNQAKNRHFWKNTDKMRNTKLRSSYKYN
jgi:hypothetical protein